MSLDEYIKFKNFKPLSEKEIAHGRTALRIYGTQEPMPWGTIFARIESGQDIEEIGKQYGHARKIALFAKLNGVDIDPVKQEFVETEAEHRKQIQHIANTEGVEVATTLLQRVNEIAPDFDTNMAILADKMVKKAISKLDDKFLEASDMLNIAKAVQTTTDTIGKTQRHASATSIHTGKIEVQGFSFVLDVPTEVPVIEESLEAVITDEGNTDD